MAELGLVESDTADRPLLQAFDTDNSGTLNFDEFERLIRNRLHRTSVEPFVTHEVGGGGVGNAPTRAFQLPSFSSLTFFCFFSFIATAVPPSSLVIGGLRRVVAAPRH